MRRLERKCCRLVAGRRVGGSIGRLAALLVFLGGLWLGPAGSPSAAAEARGATGVPPSLQWRSIGPLRGSRSTAVAGSPSRHDEYYFGAMGGGLWKTTDGGTNWQPVTDGQLTSSSVGAVAVCEANPDVVYIGTGEVQWRENIMQGDGVYKSVDAGLTWTHVGLEQTQTISRIRIDPADCNRVYAAAMGHPFGANTERGVFRSTDGGASWSRVLYVNSQTGAADLVLDRNNPQVLYAGMWQAFMRPWGGQDAGPGSGLFKSTDGGSTWTNLTPNPGLPRGIIGKVGVAVSGADSSRVYAIVSAEEPDAGLYVSDDAGATWRLSNAAENLRARPHYYTRVYADPNARDTVYVLTDGLWRSTNGGVSFQSIGAPHADHHDLWIAPNDSRRLIDANDGGANVSVTGGPPWTAQDYPTGQMYRVTTTNDVPYLVCGGQQENGAVCLSSDGIGDQFFSPGGGETAYVAIDPEDSNIFYAGNYGGTGFTAFDRRLPFQRKRIDVWPEVPFGFAPIDQKERFAWSFPIVTTPAYPKALYTSSQHLFRSANGGQSWKQISPDLTRADPATMQLPFGPIYFHPNSSYTYATISAVAPSPLNRTLVWAGSDDGLVHLTRSGGGTWTDVTPPDLAPFTTVAVIDPSPHDPARAYLAAYRYKLDDRTPLLLKTTDYGRTWTKIVNGIPADDFARVIREDPVRAGLLYAGTEHGVYVSFDDGASWQSLRQNLPDTQVRDLVVKGDDLVIATYGRAFYVMDDITPLRQPAAPARLSLARAKPAEGVTFQLVDARSRTTAAPAQQRRTQAGSFQLFDPVDPIRLVDPGVTVVYSLAQPAGQAVLEFFDNTGKLIRTFSGAQIPTTAGQHSFTWNLRYPGPTTFPGIVFQSASTTNGPRAPWGKYSVRLTVDGEAQTQAFEIKGDPRLHVGPGEIRQQFKLALDVRDRTSDANEGVIAIRDCRTQIDDRITRANDAQVTAQGNQLKDDLDVIERELYQTLFVPGVGWEGVEPLRLNNQIAALLPIIESAESQPTDQTYDAFNDLSHRLDDQLDALDHLFATRVPAFNQLVQAHGLEPISCARPG